MSVRSVPSYAAYFAIWAWLIALLVAGVFVPQLSLSKMNAVLLIFSIALVKAALVTLFYMHLKSEKIPVWVVAVSPFFLISLAVFLIFVGIALS